jgi:hypothetical protein
MAPCALEHLPSTVCAQSITYMLADELDQDEIRPGERSYALVVLGEVRVIAGDHRKACTANGASREDAVDYYGGQSLRASAVGVDSLDDVDVWRLALATRVVFPEVQIAEPQPQSSPIRIPESLNQVTIIWSRAVRTASSIASRVPSGSVRGSLRGAAP